MNLKKKWEDFLFISEKIFTTEEYLRKLGLNERQIKAVMYVKEKGKITNREHRSMFSITDRTALNERINDSNCIMTSIPRLTFELLAKSL